MRKFELDRLLVKTVAEALGLSLPPVASTHHRVHGKPHRVYARKPGKPAMNVRPDRTAAHA